MKKLLLLLTFGFVCVSQLSAQKIYEFDINSTILYNNGDPDSVHYGDIVQYKLEFTYTGTSTGAHDSFPGGTYLFNFYVSQKPDFPTAGVSYTKSITLPGMAFNSSTTTKDTIAVSGKFFARHEDIVIIWPTGGVISGPTKDSLDAKQFNRSMVFWVYDHTAGVDQATASGNFRFYPNPAKDMLNIEMPNAEKGTIRLMDMTGKTVITKAFESTANELISLPLNDGKVIPDGMYFIAIETANYSQVSKVVIGR